MARVHNSFDLLLSNGDDAKLSPHKSKENSSSQSRRRKAKNKNKGLPTTLADTNVSLKAESSDSAVIDSKDDNFELEQIVDSRHSEILAEGKPVEETTIATATAEPAINSGPPPDEVAIGTINLQDFAKFTDSSALPDVVQTSTIAKLDPVTTEVQALELVAGAYTGNLSSKFKLWYDWIARSQSNQSETQYLPLTWKQIFLQSKALEISVNSCLDFPMAAAERLHLQNLLSAFLPHPESAQVLSQVVLDLAQGLSPTAVIASEAAVGGKQKQQQRVDGTSLLQSAKEALASSVAALKGGESGWAIQSLAAKLAEPTTAATLAALHKKTVEAEQLLSELRSNPSESTTLPERTRLSQLLVALSEQRLELLLPDTQAHSSKQKKKGSGSGSRKKALSAAADSVGFGEEEEEDEGEENTAAVAAASQALHAIRQLASNIRSSGQRNPAWSVPAGTASANHMQQQQQQQQPRKSTESQSASPPSLPAGGSGRSGGSTELAQFLADVEHESAHIAAQLSAAEHEVARLKAAAVSVESRRQALLSKQAQAQAQAEVQAGGGGSSSSSSSLPMPASSSSSSSAWCAQQLGVVHALEALLLRPPGLPAEAVADLPPAASAIASTSTSSSSCARLVDSVVCQAVLDHLQALAVLAAHKQQQLKEAGQRLHFSQAKVASMDADLARLKQHQQQGKMQLVAKELQKPREMYVNMTKDWEGRVELLLREAEGVESRLQSPALRSAVALLPPHPPLHMLLNDIGHTLQQIQGEYAAIQAGPPAGTTLTAAVPPSRPLAQPQVQPPTAAMAVSSRLKQPQQQQQQQHGAAVAVGSQQQSLGASSRNSIGHMVQVQPKENAWTARRALSTTPEFGALGFQFGESDKN